MSNVRGPTSALTEFLKEKNIRIQNTNRFRRRQEPEAQQQPEEAAATTSQPSTAPASPGPSSTPTRASAKRSASGSSAPSGRASKRVKAKKGLSMNFEEDDDDDDEDDEENDDAQEDAVQASTANGEAAATGNIWSRIHMGEVDGVSRKATSNGSVDTCPGCNKRFSITQYTCQTPSGGLCHRCGPPYNAHLAQNSSGSAPRSRSTKAAAATTSVPAATTGGTRKTAAARKKRTIQKPQDKAELPKLQSLCINIISEYIEDVEALGGIGMQHADKLSKSISKNRRLNPKTVQLFLEPEIDSLSLYDCSKLHSDALQSIAVFSPLIRVLNLQLCGQLDNKAVDAWSTKLKHLQSIELYGPYLVRVEAWHRFFENVGSRLTSFKIRESPRFNLGCIEKMVEHCPDIQELGLAQIGPLNGAALKPLHAYTNLRYLDVSDPGVTSPGVPPESLQNDDLIELLSHVGSNLTYLNIGGNADLTDRVILEGILPYCPSLRHLRIGGCEQIHGDALMILFDSFSARKYPGLQTLHLDRCIKFDDAALCALIQHSGPFLVDLNINSCDKLSKDALKCIAPGTPLPQLPQVVGLASPSDEGEGPSDAAPTTPTESTETDQLLSVGCSSLETLDVGFVRVMDDDAITTILDGAKQMKEIKVFGDNKISDFVALAARCRITGLEKVPIINKTIETGY